MAHDTEVAERVRDALAGRQVREVRMFGGLAFMVDDRMVVCVSAGGADLLVRVHPDSDAQHLRRPGARRAEMGAGRPMGEGWIAVEEPGIAGEEDFARWMAAALEFHASGSGGTGGRSKRTGASPRRRPA
ncbi:TfoX/Sxy family protein [Kineococcus sp. TBRC 1896]|uniref:TfoX/Sxy family protein n=1 Tax=Kineococcus mangrovi TaxID=1660183 RepID=A0ABV4I3I8_9ACTN